MPAQRCAGVHESTAIRPHIVNTSERWLFRGQRGFLVLADPVGLGTLRGPLVDIKRAGWPGLDQGQPVSMIIVLIAEKTELQPA